MRCRSRSRRGRGYPTAFAGRRPSSSTARSASTHSIPIAIARVPRRAPEMRRQHDVLEGERAPPRPPARARRRRAPRRRSTPAASAATSARSSTIGPRAVFTRTARRAHRRERGARRSGGASRRVSGTWRLTTSASPSRARRSSPATASDAVAPNASASRAVSRPMRPAPTTSSRLPSRLAPEHELERELPRPRAAGRTGRPRRSAAGARASGRPRARPSCASRTSGVFATTTPRSAAAARSMLLTPTA